MTIVLMFKLLKMEILFFYYLVFILPIRNIQMAIYINNY